jgi:ZIP family zinc transporter
VRLSAELIPLGLATGAATFAGGALALALKGRTRWLMGFTTGAVVGVAILELLPSAWRAAEPVSNGAVALVWAGLAFLGYLVIDRGLSAAVGHTSTHRGHLGAASLTLHSLMDGLVVGLAFHASPTIGLTVAAAVIAHDLSDGVNTVNLSLGGGSSPAVARRWLIADALAPTAGIVLAQVVRIPQAGLSPMLAALAGLLLYAGAGDAALKRRDWTLQPVTALTAVLGFGLILMVSRLVPS